MQPTRRFAFWIVLIAVGVALIFWLLRQRDTPLPFRAPVQAAIPAAAAVFHTSETHTATPAPAATPSIAIGDPITCFPKEPTGDLDEPPVPDAITRYARQVAQRLRSTGDLHDQVVSALVDDGPPMALRAAQADAAARAAVMTADPTLYGLSRLACEHVADGDGFIPGAETCTRLNHAQQLRLDPDNARFWLLEAASAHERNDGAAADEALYRASTARRYELPTMQAARAVLAAMRPDDPVELRYGLLYQFMKEQRLVNGLGVVRTGAWLSTLCDDTAVAEPNRAQVCDRLARNLLQPTRHPDAAWIAIAIARALDWNDDALGSLGRGAYLVYQARTMLPSPGEAACGGAAVGLAIATATIAANPPELLRSPEASNAMDIVEEHRARRPK